MNIDQNVHAFEERWIGRGTYGQVFELVGHQPPAVIKYIDCDTKEKLAAFKIEWETMKELNHTNLVPLIGTKIIEGFSFGTRRDKFGIIMEYCEGGTLKNLLQEKKMIYSMGTVLEWAQQLFDGLSYLFERHKLVHRDIKPDNVFVMGCMANYTLKFGDFGLVKVIEQTGTGSLGPTTRYTSPPQFDGTKAVPDQMKADPENSHRNDVYSLGLILWEIIERRIVYSAYNYEAIYDGQGCFNRDTFLIDIILKRFTKLESPQCQSDIQELVDRCTNFNRDHRPNAKEIFEEIKRIKSENLFISELDPLPRIEESQTKLLRPIGFDGQFERIAVEVDELSSFSSLSFSLSSSNRFSYGPFIEELTQKDASSALFEAKIVPLLLEKFLSLSDEQKENFYQNVPKIISRNVDKIHKFHEWEELYGKIQGNCTYSSPVKNSENIEELFELMIINDFYCLVECLYSFFNFLESSVKISLSPWSNYQESVKVLAKLEDFKRSRYTTRIYFKSYFSEATHETWFFIDEVHQELQRFVRKDLLNVMTFDGYRLNVREREILISGARGAAGYERLPEHDELHLTGLEPIDLFKVIEAMKKISENLVKMGEITMSKQVLHWALPRSEKLVNEDAKDLPIPGYGFQLRNPPRRTCTHAPKCPLESFDPLKRSYEKIGWKFASYPEKMRLSIYDCTTDEERDYLEYYFLFLDIFHQLLVNSSTVFTFLHEKRMKFLQFSPLKVNYFLFKNFVFKTDQGDGLLILLDYPSNYESGEKVPCIALDLKFRRVEADLLRKYFEPETNINVNPDLQNTLMVINENFEARMLAFNGNRLSEWFDLKTGKDSSSFPEQTYIKGLPAGSMISLEKVFK